MEESFLNVQGHLKQVWNLPLPENQFSPSLQYAIKSILSYVVLARSFTVHIYFLAYVLLLYVAFFEERPRLLVPWLLLGAARNLVVDTVATITGAVICTWIGGITPVCLQFLVIKGSQLVLSSYLWKSVLTLYHELRVDRSDAAEDSESENLRQIEIAVRRRKAKSLADEGAVRRRLTENVDATNVHLSVSDDDELTLDETPSVKVKTSCSLDMLMAQLDYDIDRIESLLERRNEELLGEQDATLAVRAGRFLRLTPADFEEARAEKEERERERRERERRDRERKERERRRTQRDLSRAARTTIDSGIQANTLGKSFLKKWNVIETNIRKVNTVDVGIQVNTLSRRWLKSISREGSEMSYSPEVNTGSDLIIFGTFNAGAQTKINSVVNDESAGTLDNINTSTSREKSIGSVSGEMRTRRKVSKIPVDSESEAMQTQLISSQVRHPTIATIPSSQGIQEEPEENIVTTKPPIPPNKISSSSIAPVSTTVESTDTITHEERVSNKLDKLTNKLHKSFHETDTSTLNMG